MDGDGAGREAAMRMTPRLKGEGLDVFTVEPAGRRRPERLFPAPRGRGLRRTF